MGWILNPVGIGTMVEWYCLYFGFFLGRYVYLGSFYSFYLSVTAALLLLHLFLDHYHMLHFSDSHLGFLRLRIVLFVPSV